MKIYQKHNKIYIIRKHAQIKQYPKSSYEYVHLIRHLFDNRILKTLQ